MTPLGQNLRIDQGLDQFFVRHTRQLFIRFSPRFLGFRQKCLSFHTLTKARNNRLCNSNPELLFGHGNVFESPIRDKLPQIPETFP